MSNLGALSVLCASPIFRELPVEALTSVAALCRNRIYGRGQIVFEENTPGTTLFGVISGRLLISTSSSQGEELHLNIVEPGEIVGEIAFLDGSVRTATGRAAETSVCFQIERKVFFHLLENRPELSIHLMQLVCKRVRWMTRLMADSVFLSVPERLAIRLQNLAKPTRECARGEVKISQADLAQFLGITRQVVNGYLRDWQREGRVELARGTIRIKNLDGMRRGQAV